MLYQNLPALERAPGYYTFSASVKAEANEALCTPIAGELWTNFCHTASCIHIAETGAMSFRIGSCEAPGVSSGEYAVRVTENGVSVVGSDEKTLQRGFLTLLDFIDPVELSEGKELFRIPCFTYHEKPEIAVRMIHLCIFPETSYSFLRKTVRLYAFLQYTHVILEFWGMLKYDCMKELAWPFAFTKEQVRACVDDANGMGMEVIPMFNHLGHAAGSRSCSGKHVILDQNPRYQTFFTEDGWVWDITRRDVRDLMKKIRSELIELCGEGSYFHIGCDEAYCYGTDPKKAEVLVDYLREVTDDLETYHRRPIMWGDMLLYNHETQKIKENVYYFNCHDEQVERILLEGIDRRMIIADWEYEPSISPFDTSIFFTELGFDTLCCPWSQINPQNIDAGIRTAKEIPLDGVMITTWQALEEVWAFLRAGLHCRDMEIDAVDAGISSGALLRRLLPSNGDYAAAGYRTKQVVQKFS